VNVPSATYRLQFRSGLTFDAAAAVLPYLRDLGVSHIYASPILKAVKGSPHGYEVTDPAEIDPELGGREALDRLFEILKDLGLSWIQDIVPNHMSYSSGNRCLMDIMEKGPRSRYRGFFDIDWEHPYQELRGRVLAPFLAEFYGTCLDRADIQLTFGPDGFAFAFGEAAFPLRIEDYAGVLRTGLPDAGRLDGPGREGISELAELADEFAKLGAPGDPAVFDETVSRLKADLEALSGRSLAVSGHIGGVLRGLNGTKGRPQTFDALDELLRRQNFRLSFWKVGNEELNYRRFFAINGLVSMRTERPEVFGFLHDLIFGLIREGKVAGLRIDHLDGLHDPREYLRRVRESFPDLFIVAEKILDRSEELPPDMPLQGTTGYDFLNRVNGLFVDRGGEAAFDRLYARFTGLQPGYRDLVVQKKRLFMGTRMAGDIDNLARVLKAILGASRYGRDMTSFGLKRGLVEMLAHFPVYRTYVSEGRVSGQDESVIREAAGRAKASLPGSFFEIGLIERILLLQHEEGTPEPERREWERFVKRFQQLSCALMAKGAEDTTFYIYNRLLALNEVGGDPAAFGTTADEFHEFQRRRRDRGPDSLNATATHDTKRGEDARARIAVLSEMPKEWEAALKAFAKACRKLKRSVNGRPAPSPNDEYLIYQALVGAYPFAADERAALPDRMRSYVVKAIREAKVHTAWIRPDTDYEAACEGFVSGLFDGPASPAFMKAFLPFVKRVSAFGIFDSLSQLLLKTCSPGVPDIYQGGELWDLSLVDPDNRRPVDFERRKRLLAGIRAGEADLPGLVAELLEHREDGRIKLYTTRRLLAARASRADLFRDGDYIPLETSGRYGDHIVGFARSGAAGWCVALAPRFLSRVIREDEVPLGEGVWRDTAIAWPEGRPAGFDNVLTGQRVLLEKASKVGGILDLFPVALLVASS
jgi:(1->4)-alpha-D-glucan 1-alpha-D-glucosylmutase